MFVQQTGLSQPTPTWTTLQAPVAPMQPALDAVKATITDPAPKSPSGVVVVPAYPPIRK